MEHRDPRAADGPGRPFLAGHAPADPWLAVAALEPRQRSAALLAHVVAELATEALIEAIVDRDPGAAWLMAGGALD